MKPSILRFARGQQPWSVVLLTLLGAATVWGSAEYFAGFEPDEGYTADPLPQLGWVLEGEGTAAVQTVVTYEGLQALEIGPASIVDRDLSALISGDVIWIDAFARVTPQDPLPNPNDVGLGSSLIHFSVSMGIACFDGARLPAPDWVSTNVAVDPNQWYRITIRQDYRNRTWDCYINGERKLANLGFKDAIGFLSGFKASSSSGDSSYLDNFWAGTDIPVHLYPGSDFQQMFEFSTLWHTDDQTAYNETLFRLYDITQDNVIDALDLYLLVANLRQEP